MEEEQSTSELILFPEGGRGERGALSGTGHMSHIALVCVKGALGRVCWSECAAPVGSSGSPSVPMFHLNRQPMPVLKVYSLWTDCSIIREAQIISHSDHLGQRQRCPPDYVASMEERSGLLQTLSGSCGKRMAD